jgi:D-threo-aldose 1-dehydrogenase
MKPKPFQHRLFGCGGLRVPPIIFGTGALANARRTIPDQTKLDICGGWFAHVATPVALEMSLQPGHASALEVLARAFERLEVAPEEVVIVSRFGCHDAILAPDALSAAWGKAGRRLGADYRPQLVAIDSPDDYLAAARSPADRDQRLHAILGAYRALENLKATGEVAGIGIAAKDWHVVREIESAVRLDWVMLTGCFTILRHPPGLLQFMSELAARRTPILNAGIFHCDFLAGGSSFDGRMVNPEDPADQSLLAWRKAFVALCHGHGVTPVHASIQFALAAPGVVAVVVNTSRPDRIAENVAAAVAEAPHALWASMQEEGLLSGDHSLWS